MKRIVAFLALSFTLPFAVQAQSSDSTALGGATPPPQNDRYVIPVMAQTSRTVYQPFISCWNPQATATQSAPGVWVLSNPTRTDMNFICRLR